MELLYRILLYVISAAIPFVLIVILPIVLSWKFGSKELAATRRRYISAVLLWARRHGVKVASKEERGLYALVEFNVDEARAKFSVDFRLVERRTYVWYLLKLFRRTPSDRFVVQVTLSREPSALLYVIPDKSKWVLRRLAGYLVKLTKLDIPIRSVHAYTDDPGASRYFTEDVMIVTERALPHIEYAIVDYSAPHIEVMGRIKRGVEVALALELALRLARRVAAVRGKRVGLDIAKFIRKALRVE